MDRKVKIIGGGLAGSEAAIYLANSGIKVDLYEMRPVNQTPVHKTGLLAELVCSNSLGSYSVENASGLLKEEIKILGSSLIPFAEKFSVPAGGALAVDRTLFAEYVTKIVQEHEFINLIHDHVHDIHLHEYENEMVLIATGPLTSDELAASLINHTGQQYLHFYDAIAPIVEHDSINMNLAYKMDRYNKAPDSPYINCPMTEEEYENFYSYLISAPTIELKEFEKDVKYFEGCMPVEVLAKRGKDTLRYGPMKPVGLPDPRTGEIPYAVVQLRQDNAIATLYNLVGFQTNLKWSAQKELLKLIPGLEKAAIIRYGVMHRNTYINSPLLLNQTLEARFKEGLFFAGQITGVEGYTESIATGLLAAINIRRKLESKTLLQLHDLCILGALTQYITTADANNFQPMNSNWGIIKPLDQKARNKKQRKQIYSKRSLEYIHSIKETVKI
ncbi:MAG: methylenetetrahydrofolate--tRNA-(uracil(54)-C(5))-methyltransferase (FADH(2)-oxidizing) TrmFO [Cyanobacteriota bacterium]